MKRNRLVVVSALLGTACGPGLQTDQTFKQQGCQNCVSPGPGPGFSGPPTLPVMTGLVLWLRADQIQATPNGNPITGNWPDLSHTVTPLAATNGPIFESAGSSPIPRATVQFNSASDSFAIAASAFGTMSEVTMIAVGKIVTISGFFGISTSSSFTVSTDKFLSLETETSPSIQAVRVDTPTPTTKSVSGGPGWHAFFGEFDGGGNQAAIAIDGGGLTSVAIASGISYDCSSGEVQLGTLTGGGATSGEVAEIIVYDRVITGAEMTSLLTYFSGRYGI
jgi:hypothetical protein